LLVAGAVVLGLAVRIAKWPVSDRIVNDVIASVRQPSGNNPSQDAMRDHIRKQKTALGHVHRRRRCRAHRHRVPDDLTTSHVIGRSSHVRGPARRWHGRSSGRMEMSGAGDAVAQAAGQNTH
jgi:hypothetical protein